MSNPLLKEIHTLCKNLEEDYELLAILNTNLGKPEVALVLRGAKAQFRRMKEMIESVGVD